MQPANPADSKSGPQLAQSAVLNAQSAPALRIALSALGVQLSPQFRELLPGLIEVAVIVGLLLFGKIDQGIASLLLGLVLSKNTVALTWLKAHHIAALAAAVAADRALPLPRQFAPAVAALRTAETTDLPSSSTQVEGPEGTPSKPQSESASQALGAAPPGSGAGVGPKIAGLGSLCASILLLFSGCASSPFFVSGVNAGVETNPATGDVDGGTVGITISPNPNAPKASPASGKSIVPFDGKAIIPLSDFRPAPRRDLRSNPPLVIPDLGPPAESKGPPLVPPLPTLYTPDDQPIYPIIVTTWEVSQ